MFSDMKTSMRPADWRAQHFTDLIGGLEVLLLVAQEDADQIALPGTPALGLLDGGNDVIWMRRAVPPCLIGLSARRTTRSSA
jgi:hypothetical protein